MFLRDVICIVLLLVVVCVALFHIGDADESDDIGIDVDAAVDEGINVGTAADEVIGIGIVVMLLLLTMSALVSV